MREGLPPSWRASGFSGHLRCRIRSGRPRDVIDEPMQVGVGTWRSCRRWTGFLSAGALSGNVDGSQLRGREGSSGSSQPSPAGWLCTVAGMLRGVVSVALLVAARVPAVRGSPARNRAARRLGRSVAPGLPARSSGGSHTGPDRADDRESMAAVAILRTWHRI